MPCQRPDPTLPRIVLALLLTCVPASAQGDPAGGPASGSRGAVEASGRRVTTLIDGWGRIARGEPVPELAFESPGGDRFDLAAVAGKPAILVLTLASGSPEGLDELAAMGARYGVATIVVAVYATAADFAAWLREQPAERGWLAVRDAAGAFVPAAGGEPGPLERADWHATTLVGRVYPRGMAPRLPTWVALDAAGRVVGSCGARGGREGVAHLLQHAGVELEPGDRPTTDSQFTTISARRVPEGLRPAGTAAPDFVMSDAAGQRVSLAALRGKVVVLDFWATWCAPCLAALPHTQQLARTYREQGVVVVASCTRDERAKFDAWVAKHGAEYPDIVFAHDPSAMSEERAAKVQYGVSAIPVQFVIDREGRVVGSIQGYFPGEVLLDAMLARAGIAVDPQVLEKALEDERQRGWGRTGADAADGGGAKEAGRPDGGEARVIRR